jgi:hypothetical protein
MDEHETIVAELVGARERAAALLKAKLEAVAREIEETAARTVSELGTVLPPDLEVLFPLASLPERVSGLTRPVLAATPSLECLRTLDRGRAQSEVLQELLRQLEPWCGPRAIVVFRDGNVIGWSGSGFTEEDPVRGWRGPLADSRAFQKVSEGVPVQLAVADDPLLASWLPASDNRALVVPLSLRGKVVGGLLSLDAGHPLVAETVQLLAFLTGLLLETLAVRPVVPTPAILDPVEIGPPPADLLPVVEEADEIELAAPAPAAVPTPVPAMPPVAAVPPPVHEEIVRPAPPASVPAAVPAPSPVPAPELREVHDAASTVQLKVTAQPVAPVRTPEIERKHEEARRFARLLVSEIRLYNEQAVQDGRAARDIYSRLKEDIDRSREMYEQRVPADVRADSNYFYEELVRILGDGDPDTLGL